MEVIAESARRHGISDEDIIHAYRNAFQADALDEGVILLTAATSPDASLKSPTSWPTTRPL